MKALTTLVFTLLFFSSQAQTQVCENLKTTEESNGYKTRMTYPDAPIILIKSWNDEQEYFFVSLTVYDNYLTSPQPGVEIFLTQNYVISDENAEVSFEKSDNPSYKYMYKSFFKITQLQAMNLGMLDLLMIKLYIFDQEVDSEFQTTFRKEANCIAFDH